MIAAVDPEKHVADTVAAYSAGVTSGEIVAGRRVRLAVARHASDLQHAADRGWYFDEGVATRACLFFPECLRHSIGQFAGEPFELSPWQMFCTWVLFGWLNAQTKRRRFLRAYLSVARKNGKTTWASGLGVKALYFDEPFEPAAHVYCAATKEDQAKILYGEASRMVAQSKWLLKRSKIRRAPNVIEFGDGFFRPLGSDSTGTDGLNPSCVLLDELHAWREFHRPLREKLATGGGSRSQPLEIVITTAGDADSQLWSEEDEDALRVVEAPERGEVWNDRLFSYVASIDDDDDPFDEAVWAKANPNLGVSVELDYLRAASTDARNNPTKTNQFIRYHCNRKTEASERSISVEAWNSGAASLTVQPGAVGFGGIDFGRSNDWAAVAMCFPIGKDSTKPERWEFITQCWTCTDGGFNCEHEPFKSWIKAGRLIACKGNFVDTYEIEQWIAANAAKYQIKTWAFDPAFARDLAQRLQDQRGLTMFEFTQTPRFYNNAYRRFLNELPNGTIRHGNDPVLTWQAGNVQTYRNAKDEWMPDKGQRKRKIDGIVAALMAYSESLYIPTEATGALIVF